VQRVGPNGERLVQDAVAADLPELDTAQQQVPAQVVVADRRGAARGDRGDQHVPIRVCGQLVLVKRWDDNPDLAGHGVAFLLHGLLDDVVDGHFAAVQTLDGEIEDLQDLLFADTGPHAELQRRSFELRKSLVLLRRVVLPMRELVNTLLRRDLHVLDPEMTPYYQDVYDHVLRATEWTESLRDLVSTILETRITLQGNQLNEVMKKLTSWAAIIAIPTAVTGFYGQNVPYPGFQQQWGFLSSITLIVGLGLALYLTFKRKGWL
jgi:magnesium transporter